MQDRGVSQSPSTAGGRTRYVRVGSSGLGDSWGTLTVAQAAAVLGVSRRRVYRWLDDGTLRAWRRGDGRWAVDGGAVDALRRRRAGKG